MSEQKDLSSPPLTKTSKSHLTTEQSSTKMTRVYQQGYSASKEATTRWQERCFLDRIKSHTRVGDPQTRKQLCHRVSPTGGSFEPRARLSSLKFRRGEEEASEHLPLKATGDLRTGAAQAWGKQGVNSWKMHKVSQALRPRGKQCLHRSLGQTCLLVLDSLFCRQGLAVLYSGDKDAGGRGPRDYSSV